MPFTRIKHGKNKGKYRSPSGRVFTYSQVKRYYARGGMFDQVGDAAASDSAGRRDPTLTGGIRRAFHTNLNRRWRKLDNLVREAFVDGDVFGLSVQTSQSVQNVAGHSTLAAFQTWFNSALDASVTRDTQWIDGHVGRAYHYGLLHAAAGSGQRLPGAVGKAGMLSDMARSELRGVTDAVSQRASRIVADGILMRMPARAVGHNIHRMLRSTGIARGKLLADYSVVRSHAEGTLDGLQGAGVRRVGLITETRSSPVLGDGYVQDARRKKWNPERAERRLARQLKKVGESANIETAGDDRVCDECDEIAAGGPYEIDMARGMLPVHVNCRCAFIKADKETEDAWDPDKHPRHPAGSSEGGEFAPSGEVESIVAAYREAARNMPHYSQMNIGETEGRVVENKNLVVDPGIRERWDEKGTGLSVEQVVDRFSGGYPVHYSRIEEDSEGDGGVEVNMSLENGTGMSRTFSADGTKVFHNSLIVPKALQGQGIGKNLLKSQFELYDRMGISEVQLYANDEVGAHAWARYGFVPSEKSWERLRGVLTRRFTKFDMSPETWELLNDPDPISIWGIADGSDGKKLLLNQSWYGYFDLSNPLQRHRFRRYVGN